MDARGNDIVEAVIEFRSEANGEPVSRRVALSGTDAVMVEKFADDDSEVVVLHAGVLGLAMAAAAA